jgi:3-deoxy-D-manno-octulosonate 8-phosphate phosphatase (KDO 8-P phosphatase)
MKETEIAYTALGGQFLTPATEIADKLKNIKAFVYDWDGVFNNGQKSLEGGSTFSEVDSMGTNLLRYAYYLKNQQLPISALISGEKNETAFYFSKRECFHYSFFKVADKIKALDYFCEKEKILPSEVAYFFDDVLDLPIAEICGIRIMVNQKANPLFTQYCIDHQLADYISASRGGEHAVRECTELLIALYGNYEQVLTDRKQSVATYKNYIEKRRVIRPQFFTLLEEELKTVDL